VQQQGQASRFLSLSGAAAAVAAAAATAAASPHLARPPAASAATEVATGAEEDEPLLDLGDEALLDQLRLQPGGAAVAQGDAWPSGDALDELLFGAGGGWPPELRGELGTASLADGLAMRLQPRSLAEMAADEGGGEDLVQLGAAMWDAPGEAAPPPPAPPLPPPAVPGPSAALSAALQTTLQEQAELHRQCVCVAVVVVASNAPVAGCSYISATRGSCRPSCRRAGAS